MERFQFQDLVVTWTQDGPRQLLCFSGRSHSRNPGLIMGPMWSQVLETAKQGGKAIDLDFVKLEHFNSSTISALVQFINQAHDTGVKLVVRYDGKLNWQTLSFEALHRAIASFSAGAVRFESR